MNIKKKNFDFKINMRIDDKIYSVAYRTDNSSGICVKVYLTPNRRLLLQFCHKGNDYINRLKQYNCRSAHTLVKKIVKEKLS